MSATTMGLRLVAPHPGRMLIRLGVVMLPPLVGLVLLLVLDARRPSFHLFLLQFAVAQAAIIGATGHKEIMASSFTFFQPGLRRRLALTQLVWAFLAAALAVVTGMVVSLPAPAPVLFGMTLCVYGATALLSFSFRCSYQLPAWSYYLFFLVRPFDRAVSGGAADRWLTVPWPWLVGAAVLLAALTTRLLTRTLHRRLSGTMVLAPEDLFRASRLQAAKELRSRHQRPGSDLRWRASLLDRFLDRSAAAAARGDEAASRAWLVIHAGTAQSITRRRWVLALIVGAIAAFLVWGGYMDSWQAEGDLEGWFSGLVYAWATVPFVGTFLAMNNLTAVPSSRRAGPRSELMVLVRTAAAAALLAAAIGGVFAILQMTLPAVTWRGATVTYAVSNWHGMVLIPLLAPLVWLAVALRPRPGSNLPTLVVTQGFLFGHILMTFVPARISIPAFAALMVVAGAVAWNLRRRWWRTGDRPV